MSFECSVPFVGIKYRGIASKDIGYLQGEDGYTHIIWQEYAMTLCKKYTWQDKEVKDRYTTGVHKLCPVCLQEEEKRKIAEAKTRVCTEEPMVSIVPETITSICWRKSERPYIASHKNI